MTAIATVRPHGWDLALLVHVLGAMVLVGALALAGSALILAWRAATPPSYASAIARF